LLLVTAGQSRREVVELFGENGTTVERWVSRFEKGGLDDALREGEREGRPRSLNAKDWRRLQGDLRKTPRDFDLAATIWDGPILPEHLRRRYGVELGVWQCQRLFREMGFRLDKPRPQFAQSDPLKVAAVKNFAVWLAVRASNCGAWMNVTSSNTARAAASPEHLFRPFQTVAEKTGLGLYPKTTCGMHIHNTNHTGRFASKLVNVKVHSCTSQRCLRRSNPDRDSLSL
jgi:transposase